MFAGTPAAAVPSLDALLKSRHEVAAVITRPDAPAGRGRRVGPSPVAERAAEVGLDVLKPPTPRDEGFLRHLRALAPDCCPVTAYGALIPQAALEIPRHGWVNLHFSLLPAWRGAAPVAHAIAHGDDITGATTFGLVAELDAGPVYGVVTEPIGEQDTAGDLLARIAESGASLLVATLDGIEAGQLEPRPQPAEGISYAPKLTPHDAQVRWSSPRAGGRPADPCLHSRSRCMDDARGDPAEAMAGAAMPTSGRGQRARRSRVPRTGGAVGRPGGCVRRDRHPSGRTGRRAAARQAADGRRRMGPRAAPGPGRGRPAAPGLQLTVARGPAAGRGRSRGPHTGDKPGIRTDKPGIRTDKAASRTDKPGTRTDKAASRTDKPGTRTDKAASRTDKPGTRTDKAASRTTSPPAPTRPPPAPTRPAALPRRYPPGAAPGPARARRGQPGRHGRRFRAAYRPGPAGGLRGPARGART